MTKTPGIWQALSLQSTIETKKEELSQLEYQIHLLEIDQEKLSHDSRFQEQEIRRVLGFSAPDELIFEF